MMSRKWKAWSQNCARFLIEYWYNSQKVYTLWSDNNYRVSGRAPTFKFRLCFWFISCINRYISVVSGLGCSHSFLGTVEELMVTNG